MTQNEAAAEAAAEWWAIRLQGGDRAAFKAALLPLVLADLNADGVCRLECDYDPWAHLLVAVRAAGIECSGSFFSADGILPRKHSLVVRPTEIEPKEGYGNWTPHIPVPAPT